jgi:aspartate/methionine/tyrosine aminotransferase
VHFKCRAFDARQPDGAARRDQPTHDVRDTIDRLGASRIREVANVGLGRDDVLAFWFGESDEVTPPEIREAAARSLARGETFYAHNLGLPELRHALERSIASLHGALGRDRVAVTSSGVSALMLASQLLLDPGDEVAVLVPVWPNLPAQPTILGAHVKRVALAPDEHGAWRLDLQCLIDAITAATKVLIVNAPNNPTGWTLERAGQQALLEHCRRTGTWIVADEVYEQLWYGPGRCAPSFLDVASPDDRLVVIGSFSKSLLMTGWRLGWIVVPRGPYLDAIGKLIEFNTSCAPVFVQRGALAGLEAAEQLVPALAARMRERRDLLVGELQALAGVQVAPADAGMYAFFRVEGQHDSMALAKRLVADHGLGLAPGVAFGDEGEGWLRWCFASQDPSRLLQGVARLRDGLREELLHL